VTAQPHAEESDTLKCPKCGAGAPARLGCSADKPLNGCMVPALVHAHHRCARCEYDWIRAPLPNGNGRSVPS